MRTHAIGEWTVNFIILIFATSTIAQPFVIPSASMESTLMTGDHVLVDKMAYAPPGALSRWLLPYERIQHGDIVVFRYPMDERQMYVKRVVGLPGDRIRLEHGQVWRNGSALHESYVQHIFGPSDYRDNFPDGIPSDENFTPRAAQMLACCVVGRELAVPAGSYFVMGDNRDNSLDSRYWGLVPEANIVGKPVLVWWSYEASGEDLTKLISVRHIIDVATHFFTKTRWDRTMRFVRT